MYSVCDGDCDSDNTIVNSNGGSIYLGNWVYLGFGQLEIKQQGFKIFRQNSNENYGDDNEDSDGDG